MFHTKEAFPYFGIISLAGYLKDKGVESIVLIANLEKDFNSKLKDIKPDLIGISVLTTEHTWLVEISQQIKNDFPDIPIIVGGVHAMLYPKAILQIPCIDYVCTGEGELTLTNLCESIRKGRADVRGIKGIGYRNGNDMIINEGGVFVG